MTLTNYDPNPDASTFATLFGTIVPYADRGGFTKKLSQGHTHFPNLFQNILSARYM